MSAISPPDRGARGRERPARRRDPDHPDRHRNRQGHFRARQLCRRQPPAGSTDLGGGGSLGRSRRRDQPPERRLLHRPLSPRPLADLFAASAAQVDAIDTVFTNFRDDAGFRAECIAGAARRLHRQDGDPSGAGRRRSTRSSRPAPAELAKAEAIIALFAANPGLGVIGLDGEMLDRPHLIRAQRLKARADKLAE
jgi:hypothetical protein